MGIFLLIYVSVLAVLIASALRCKIEVASDRIVEYRAFLEMLDTGRVFNNRGGLISACLLVTGIPYVLSKLGVDKLVAFRITPCFFYALMPSFCFLIARLYLDTGMSLVATLFILSHFYFAFDPNAGRLSIAWGLLAGAIWGLLSGNILIGIIFTALLVIGHYGIAYHALYMLGGAWVVLLLTGNLDTNLSLMLGILVLSLGLWMGFFAKRAQRKCREFIERAFRGSVNQVSAKGQAILGSGFRQRGFPRQTEFLISWILAGIMSLGVGLFMFGEFDPLSKSLVIVAYSSIILAIIVPYISVYYGIVRVYFTTLVVLAPCFMIGIKGISDSVGISPYALSLSLVILYFLCVSGVLHALWGIDKRKPV